MFGPNAKRTKHPDTELHQLRLRAGLTVAELARRNHVSTACMSRWLSGARRAPSGFILMLSEIANDPVRIAECQAARRKTPPSPTLRIDVHLPAGLSIEQAQQLVTSALAAAMVEGARR